MSSTNTRNRTVLGKACVLNLSLARLALRWKMPLLEAIAEGATTYGDLRKELPTVSDQMLATRLRELVQEGLAIKLGAAQGAPPGARYEVTPTGTEILEIMASICAWETRWSATGAPTPATARAVLVADE